MQIAMNCNAPIKTMNCNCQKNKGMVVRHKGKLHMLQDDIFVEVFCDAVSQ